MRKKMINNKMVKCKSNKTIYNMIKRRLFCCPMCGSVNYIRKDYDEYEYTLSCSNCETVLEAACYTKPITYLNVAEKGKSYIALRDLRFNATFMSGIFL